MLINFDDFQLIDMLIFLGEAIRPNFSFKVRRTSEIKSFFLYKWFDHPDKPQNTELPPHDDFYIKLHSRNPLEAEYNEYVKLLKRGMTLDQAVIELRLQKLPPTGNEIN